MPNFSIPEPSIRALLRDTALQVSLLAQDAKPASVSELRLRCLKLVEAFDKALQERRFSPDVIGDALYAQCGLLDETVLRYLSESEKSEWDATPLQVERFNNHDAGERIYERIAFRMRELPPQLDLLECYSTILGLGFRGRYARTGEQERSAIMRSLDEMIWRLRPRAETSLIVNASGKHRPGDWLRGISPWALAASSALAALVLHLILGQALDLQLATLLQQK
ncbi:DotU family type IV/VI secretion system protein [Herbaspirillum lusitanum]|uniref:DotU family type IV/VI secretion system protein n=1 Tax=Herbaspirillum lusitanum TaxID=213312 RepID=A0ABW9ACY2_9BURK